MFAKFVSRKFFLAVATFISLYVVPNLSAATQSRLQAGVAVAYLVAQGAVDVAGVLKG